MLVALFALAWGSVAFGDEIHDAAQAGDLAKVNALLNAHPDLVFSKDKNGATPLHWAAGTGHKDVAELLLANKADVNAKDKNGMTPLHWAAANGHREAVEPLLADKADVNAKDNFGATPLHHAAANGHKDVAQLLLAHNADVNAKANQGQTPKPPDDPFSRFLADASAFYAGGGTDKSREGTTPLHLAAANGHRDVAELLLANKADVNAKDIMGATPLDHAAGNGRKDTAELLLANKADVNAKDHVGGTPLHYAAGKGHKDVAQLLLVNKADVNAKANQGETPLFVAAALGQKDVAQLLLANHADVNAKNNVGITPLREALDTNHKDVAELLLANKADVNARDNNGDTLLSSALAAGHKDTAEFLVQHGAISKPIDGALKAFSEFLRKTYFVPDPANTRELNPASLASYRKGKVTYYKSFVSIDDDGYTFALNQLLESHLLVGVPVGQNGFKLAPQVYLVQSDSVRVRFADVTQIKADHGGFDLRLMSGGKAQLDSFSIPRASQPDLEKALRALCPNANWK
jgi:ankyrin repeat protein